MAFESVQLVFDYIRLVFYYQSGIFARKYVNKNSLSNHKNVMFLSIIALLQHLLTVAIKENERIGDRNGDFFKNLDMLYTSELKCEKITEMQRLDFKI